MTSSYEQEATTVFDELVANGTIVHGPHTVVHHTTPEGYPLEFRICPALASKPNTTTTALSSSISKSEAFKWGPGSDLYCPSPRLVLSNLHNTHDLALNLFCVDRPQLLIVTRDSYRRQHTPLDAQDLAAALEVLRRYPSMYVIYNCSEKGGCSRLHKHVQGVRGPPGAWDVLVRPTAERRAPFRYFKQRVEGGFGGASAEEMLGVYQGLLAQCRDVLQIGEGEQVVPHNVVLWDDWFLVIPRRSGIVEGASTNAVGMVGSVWVNEQEGVDEWMRVGCAGVLRGLGVPA